MTKKSKAVLIEGSEPKDKGSLEDVINSLVEKKVAELKRSLVPHTCFTCRWFILRKEKPRNRACRYPGELKVKGRMCLSWELEPDASKHSRGLC